MKIAILCVLLLMPALASAQTCVQADNTHPDSVSMTWQDNSTDESGFILERKQDGGAFAVIVASIGANLTSYTDSTVKRGSVPITYTYRLQAYRASDNVKSAYSNESCITFAPVVVAPLPLKPPSGLTTAAVSSTTIRITWEDGPAYPGYVIDGKESRGNALFTQVAAVPAGAATFDWTGRRRFTPYCIRLRGDRADAEYSAVSCATTSK